MTGDPNDIMTVQEMPRPAATVNTEWTSKLGLASHDKQVAGMLSDGVHPGNAFQQPLVVCQNHGPALKAWELMTKCMQEENEAGRNRFLRPDLARKDGKQAASSATRSRAPNGAQRNQHSAGYRSRICLNNVEIRT